MSRDGASAVNEKYRFYEEFWSGQGPYPILFTRPHQARAKAYLRHDLVEQHRSVEKQLEERLLEVEPHLDLIDDGIPTIRSDLGTTLLPSGLGLGVTVQPELHPWLTEHWKPEQYIALVSPVRTEDLLHGEVSFSERFYRLLRERQQEGAIPEAVTPYVPDTEGVFDLSHLVIGNDLLLLVADQPQLAHRIQQKSLEVYLAGTHFFKELLGQAPGSMVHGHGMPVGVWFADTGARISEDSCTLISGEMVREFCLPYIRKAAQPFGRLFMHYCGHHVDFLRLVCEMQEISTLNLGNPELYDLEEVLRLCGRTGTVYFGHLPRQSGEDPAAYLQRLAALCRKHRVKLILVCDYEPASPAEKRELVQSWHRLTAFGRQS